MPDGAATAHLYLPKLATVVREGYGLEVAEYAATVVKKSVVGTGGADKTQVAFMVRRLLPTAGDASADAADALAVAIAHAHARKIRRLERIPA